MTPPPNEQEPPKPRATPLYEAHRRLGAKLIDFGGWMMPVSYPAGIVEEHKATRTAVGIFDVSHMGEVHFRGSGAAAAVQRLVTNDVGQLTDGRAMYTVACRPDGGIVDDLIVYRLAGDHFLLVVNASTTAKDLAWFREQVGQAGDRWACEIQDASDDTALIAFQGPKAELALSPLTSAPLSGLKRFHLMSDVKLAGRPVSIARTGYTGEDGFEVFCNPDDAPALWDALGEAANRHGGIPVGLGARDTLRLEARLPLYGNDLDDTTSPIEAGLGWVVKPAAGDFIGKAALEQQLGEGVSRRLAGFVMQGRGIARHGYGLHTSAEGPRVGLVTSGSYCPTVDKAVGLGYLPVELAEAGQRLFVDCRGRMIEAQVVKGPFYKARGA
jgi:aminomethyltransferase